MFNQHFLIWFGCLSSPFRHQAIQTVVLIWKIADHIRKLRRALVREVDVNKCMNMYQVYELSEEAFDRYR